MTIAGIRRVVHKGQHILKHPAQDISYTDTAPLLGADNVQTAIDSLKAMVLAGLPFVVVDAAGGWDYTSLETALNTEPANTNFYVLPGSYALTANLTVKAGTKVFGTSRSTVVVNLATFRMDFSNANVRFESMTFQNGNSGVATGCIVVSQENIIFRDCLFDASAAISTSSFVSFTGFSVYFSGIYESKFTGGTVYHVSLNANVSYVNLIDNYFNIGDKAIFLNGSVNFCIQNNRFDNYATELIKVTNTNWGEISGNFFQHSATNSAIYTTAALIDVLEGRINNNFMNITTVNPYAIDLKGGVLFSNNYLNATTMKVYDFALVTGNQNFGDFKIENDSCQFIGNTFLGTGNIDLTTAGVSNIVRDNRLNGGTILFAGMGVNNYIINNITNVAPQNFGNVFSYDTTTQVITTVATAITFNTDVFVEGFTRPSASQFTCQRKGFYYFSYSAVVRRPDVSDDEVDIYLARGGVEIPGTRMVQSLTTQNDDNHISKTVLVQAAVGDVFTLVGLSNDTDTQLSAISGAPSATMTISLKV